MLDKNLIREMFLKGKEREVLLFAFLYANCFDGWSVSASEIESRFGIPKTSLHRIMERKWNRSGMEMEWKWNKGSLIFSSLSVGGGTAVERKWNGSGTEVEQELNSSRRGLKQDLTSEQVVNKSQRKEDGLLKSNQSNKSAKNKKEDELVVEVVRYLNESSGKKYKTQTASTRKLIVRKIRDGYTLLDFKKVIDFKCSEWLNTENDQYLRPQTLFGNKFEGYLNANKTKQKQTSINFHSKISRNDQYQIATERAREIDYGSLAYKGERSDREDA